MPVAMPPLRIGHLPQAAVFIVVEQPGFITRPLKTGQITVGIILIVQHDPPRKLQSGDVTVEVILPCGGAPQRIVPGLRWRRLQVSDLGEK